MSSVSKLLVAFDFDHTVVDENTDIYIKKLISGGIPDEIAALHTSKGWTLFMGALFRLIKNQGHGVDQLRSTIGEIPLTPGFEELLKYLGSNNHEIIIISDSNTEFINWLLHKYELQSHVQCVYSNPAWTDEDGCLNIDYYHHQDWCDLSTINMCKGAILEEHIASRSKEGITFSKIVYVGDGENDYCPSLRLNDSDLVFARSGMRLQAKIEEDTSKLKATVHFWDSGNDILCRLQELS